MSKPGVGGGKKWQNSVHIVVECPLILYLVPLPPYLEPCVVDDDDDAIASFYLPFFQMTFNQVVISQSHAAV